MEVLNIRGLDTFLCVQQTPALHMNTAAALVGGVLAYEATLRRRTSCWTVAKSRYGPWAVCTVRSGRAAYLRASPREVIRCPRARARSEFRGPSHVLLQSGVHRWCPVRHDGVGAGDAAGRAGQVHGP